MYFHCSLVVVGKQQSRSWQSRNQPAPPLSKLVLAHVGLPSSAEELQLHSWDSSGGLQQACRKQLSVFVSWLKKTWLPKLALLSQYWYTVFCFVGIPGTFLAAMCGFLFRLQFSLVGSLEIGMTTNVLLNRGRWLVKGDSQQWCSWGGAPKRRGP